MWCASLFTARVPDGAGSEKTRKKDASFFLGAKQIVSDSVLVLLLSRKSKRKRNRLFGGVRRDRRTAGESGNMGRPWIGSGHGSQRRRKQKKGRRRRRKQKELLTTGSGEEEERRSPRRSGRAEQSRSTRRVVFVL
ncbi:hypothetical protein ZWY2020_008360 [Hordeum vulgare]|nr:hypothetical protein ZWY2020_008360 [Hordeum vulgare]